MTVSRTRNLTTFAGAPAGAAALLLTAAVPAAASGPPGALDFTGTGVVVQDGPFLTYDVKYHCR
ncbi:MAG: hypothetical protein GEU97_06450 [Actinophytocola sp.]|nr:hypothetical protein [Actinophytocola sp.]